MACAVPLSFNRSRRLAPPLNFAGIIDLIGKIDTTRNVYKIIQAGPHLK